VLEISQLDRSKNEYEEANRIITGGVHSGFRYRDPFPVYFQKAEGSRVWDVDGNEYVDYLVGNGAVILGHKDPKVINAVRNQLESGLTVSLESELSFSVARMLTEMVPSARFVKLSNTGTEAVMHAMQIARGFTGRKKIVKVEGCYHGWQDEVSFSVHPNLLPDGRSPAQSSTNPLPESVGLIPGIDANVLVIPFNDVETLQRVLKENGKDVAALIIEPIVFNSGCILPKEGYLETLRELTERFGILLIFDEVITGFRISPGGAQAYYNVTPDLAVFGKAIANGFPLSAVVGREDVMAVTSPKKGKVSFSGTYNGNQPSLAASLACLEQLRDGSVQKKLWSHSDRLSREFEKFAEDHKVRARLQSAGGQFQVYFTDHKVTDYPSAAKSDKTRYQALCADLFKAGILFHQSYLFHHGVSRAHSEQDVDYLSEHLNNFVERDSFAFSKK
jgi:glutamate-1-semialdehyde 2,1-aminomutase